MSCEIRIAACIQEIPTIRRCLFPTDDQKGGENWLQTCKISTSPTGDIIAIGNERRLVVLRSKWESSDGTNQYQIDFADSIHDYDRIKAILCLPIVGQSQSSHVGPDWTCILIGFDSGYIRFYTEHCELLKEEQLHCETISSVKCQSQHSPRPDISPELHPEEIYIQYQSNLCVINGSQLFPNLRNCRSQLAKIQSKGKSLDLQQQLLGIKKWGFQDQSVINDVAVVGLNLSSTFDHLMTASICGGFKTKYRSTAPNSTLVLAAGAKPYLGYHYASEGANQPILSDVAKAVASKLKSALPGWLTGSKPQTEKEEAAAAQQSVDTMGCRFGLCDLQRTANEIVLSPNRRLAAVADTLGRVILVDSLRGVALKIFKGYRDAQCAFVQVPDERKSKHKPWNKVAHFLVIYAPKKGIIEIFTVHHGTKVATFSASRHSRLLYVTHGLMGFTTTSKSRFICQFTCILVDNDGQIKEIFIPFHFALAEENSKKAKDIHLYKKLRQIVKSGDLTSSRLQNEACNVCSELNTLEIKKQTLEMLLHSKEVTAEILLNCTKYFLENLDVELDIEAAKFKVFCQNVNSMLDLYLFVTSNENEDNQNKNEDQEKTSNVLKLEGIELGKLQKLLDLLTVNDKDHIIKLSKVKFSDEIGYTASDFLAAFNFDSKVIEIKPQLDEISSFKTGETLFKRCITGELSNFVELQKNIIASSVSVEHLFNLLIDFWVNRALDIHQNLENDMSNFLTLVSTLVRCVTTEILDTEYNSISTFWGNIREYLSCSSRSFPALMAAMLCKSVAHRLELEKSDVENIEVLSQENIHWSLLIGKLEDVSMLNIILSNKPSTQHSTLPSLKFMMKDFSLTYILEQGRGSVTELVAQWLTSSGIDPENIHINEIIYKNSDGNDTNGENKLEITEGMYLDKIETVKLEPVFKYLNLLKSQFPYSLDSSAILANMCWEYALAWRENISDLSKLEAARECLLWVTNWAIQQGVHLLLWNTHLKIVVESTSKLINKVGKLPKERLCLQDTGLTDKQISEFVRICEDFFHLFINIAQTQAEQHDLKFEALWENGGNQSLVELACQHKDVDYNMLELHYLLVLTLQMITAFSVKHSKPLNNLFEASMVNLFFTDLQKNVDVNWNKGDIKLMSSRTQFLYKIISASLETVTINEEGQMYCEKHVDWMAKCLTLARGWNLDVEAFKRYQILQLYINGFDSVAEELVPAVNGTNELGTELLEVTGKRLSQYLSSSNNLGKNITALSPVLSRYLESLDTDWCSPSSLPVIKSLASIVLRCLNEDHKDFRLAELILDACLNLEEINS